MADFDFNPKPEFPGHFVIFNESYEKALLRRFSTQKFDHTIDVQPQIILLTMAIVSIGKFLAIDKPFFKNNFDTSNCLLLKAFCWRESYFSRYEYV